MKRNDDTIPMEMITMPSAADAGGTVVLADGDYPHTGVAADLLSGAARVVCCDGAAARFLSLGGTPWAIVGDCDSLDDHIRRTFWGRIFCDRDQESNDLTKAVNFCVERGEKSIVLLGATGKREDHTLGNISLLVDYARKGDVRMVSEHGVFDAIFRGTRFASFAGQQVSVFTLSPETLITTGNLKYPLHDASLGGWWRGTLNESLGDHFTIGTTGPAIVFRLFAQ